MGQLSIVGIGSSAGGLEALRKLFGAMPIDSGCGFVVAAHLDPAQESYLSSLLGRCTRMPVTEIKDATKVEPDHVYVIAPDQELRITQGVLRAARPRAPHGRLDPVDGFFRSLATDQGDRAIGIVLSGNGTRGSLGLRFIKAKGGIAIAQDPATAAFQGMPRSAIGTGVIDLVLPPEKIPAALLELAHGTGSAPHHSPAVIPEHASVGSPGLAASSEADRKEGSMSATLAAGFPAMSALIDDDGKVHYLSGHTGDYLEPTRGVPSNDLLAMARQGLWMPLRLAIHQALAGNCEITASAHVRRGSGMHPARLVVTPVGLEGAPRRLLVAFFECENGINPEDHARASRSDIDLMAELVAAHEDLRLSLEQMEVANEALHVSNEEIRFINQGLARSNAKLKNIQEEMQVLNESLTVTSDNLQLKLALLEQRTSDLSNFLHGSDLAALFLDRELRIRWFAPSVRALVNLAEADIGRPIAHFAQRFTGGDLIEDAERVLAGGSPIEAEVLSNHGRWYVRRVSPFRAEDGRTLGVAVTFADVTQRKQAEAALFREKDRAEITLRSIADAVITTTEREMVDFLNPAAEAMTGWRAAEAIGQSVDAIFQTIDERTGQPVDSLARRCLEGDRLTGSGHSLLISRDGSQIPIQDSAAPIRNGEGAVVGAVLVFRDVTEVRKLARDAAHQATHDPLTGLLNRREFEKRLDRSLVTAATLGSQHALCFIDLDGFKVVNDTAGHTAGDELLNQVASLLAHTCRSRDTLARIGGDEFCLLMEHCSLDDAVGVAAAILSAVQSHRFVWDEQAFSVGASIGIAAIDRRVVSGRQCLTDADTACYKAKRKGGNQIEINPTTVEEPGLQPKYSIQIGDIYRAIDEKYFQLFHQPIHYIGRELRQINMCEVLIRLLDERGALVTPEVFVPVAERYGMMPVIDRWVIRETFQQAARLMRQDSKRIININLSGQTINDETLLAYIMSNLAETKFPVDRLCLEITETAAIGSFRQASNFIAALRQQGCRFALDDFGKGVSSLSYLKHLKVDYVKIDGSFVLNMANDATDRALVSAINQLAHALGIETIAECAESAELIEALTDVGVDYVQGFAIGKPRPLGAAAAGGPLSAVRGTGQTDVLERRQP